MTDEKNEFEFSGYSKNHKLYVTRKKGVGEQKDELTGTVTTEYIGSGSKLHHL